MILVLGLLSLLVSTNICSAAVKGGRRIIQQPTVIGDTSGPHLHLSKGGGGGALHHTAVVQDPVSGGPVLVEKVTNIGGGGGVKGGIKGAGLGAGSAQYALSDGPFGQRQLYRVGASQYPFGLLGSDYYSYPASLLTAPRRVLGRKSVFSNNLSGLSPIGLSSGLKGGVIADPTTSQFSIGDSQIKTSVFGGGRNLYRSGVSTVPYGLMGLDYYSYPRQLLTQRRLVDDGFGLRQSSILGGGSLFTAGDSQIRGPIASPLGQEQVTIVETDPLSGGQRVTTVQKGSSGSGLKGGVLVDPTTSQFSIGDSQIKTSVFGGGRNLYRSGVSTVPYGLMGLDYYSYPRQLLTQRRLVDDGFGLQQSSILGGGSLFTAGDSQIRGPIDSTLGQEKVTVVETDPLSGGQRVTTIQKGSGGLRGLKGGQIILSGGQGIGGLRRVKTRPVIQTLQSPLAAPQVISQVKTSPGFIGRNIFGNRGPQLIYVDGGRRFPGIDIIGGSRIGDPRLGYTQLPISTRRFATLGGLGQTSIDAGATLLSPAQLPLIASLGKSAPVAKTIAGPLGFAAVGHTSPSKTITQEEVVGPAGDRQVITTVTENDSNRLVGSKIGGQVVSSPFGLSGIGQSAPTKTITQEEVVGPAGDSQIITTVTKSDPIGSSKIGGLASGGPLGLTAIGQSPIDAAISQAALGDSIISSSPLSQSLVDPLGSGQTQVSVDDVIAQSQLSGIGGGYDISGYLPRVSLLSQYPYDVPDNQLIRSVISSPVFQQQQELEQILVK